MKERIASITEKLAETNARSDAQAPQGRAKSGLAGELQDALAEIRGRRDARRKPSTGRVPMPLKNISNACARMWRGSARSFMRSRRTARAIRPAKAQTAHGSAACHG